MLCALVLSLPGRATSAGRLAAGQPCDLVASTAGVDTNPGTLAAPFRTVQKLVRVLNRGQTGCLRGTTAAKPFAESITVERKNQGGGSEADRITIRSYPGEIAKIRGRIHVTDSANFVTFSKLVLDRGGAADTTSQVSPRIDGDDVVFSDNNISGAGRLACVRVGGASNARALRATIQRNRVHDCTDAVSATYATDLNLSQNLIYDSSVGLRLSPSATGTVAVQNVLDGNARGVLFGGDAATVSTGNVVDQSIVSNPSPIGVNAGSAWATQPPAADQNQIQRSCVFAPDRPDGAIDLSHGGFSVSGIVYSDPLFADRGSNDFHIDSSSPCFALTGDIAGLVDAGGGPTDEQATASNTKPNVIFIVTDDQRAEGTLIPEAMPQTMAELQDKGTTFSNAYVTTPLCCPSRSSILTGRYAHNHLVTDNGGLTPGAKATARNLNQDTTVEKYLKDDGYRTGIFGKFLNEWNLDSNPPYWDRFGIFNRGYCPLDVNLDGTRRFYGDKMAAPPDPCPPDQYGTTFVRDQAVNFIDQSESDDSQPFFLYLTPFAPHADFKPEQKYANSTFPPYTQTAAQQEGQAGGDPLTDKPGWVQTFPPSVPPIFDPVSGVRVKQLQTLRSVDDLVKSVVDTLQARGEQDTLIVFSSDNGYSWNEHHLWGKENAYTDSIKVPLVMRYAPYTVPGATDSRQVANIDLAPTALNAAGLSLARSPAIDGTSLLAQGARTRTLTEAWGQGEQAGDPAWASTRTDTYQYIESYAADGVTITFREYYDLVGDPQELTNLYGPNGVPEGGGGDDLGLPPETPEALHDRLANDRLCEGTECPPGSASGKTDTRAPLVYLDEPTAGASVCCRVRMDAAAYDNLGVAGVRFKVDGTVVAQDTDAPFRQYWDASAATPGQHTIEAEAFDAAGNTQSATSAVNLDGSDFQAENCAGCAAGIVNTGDTVTYTFATPVTPGDISPGWDGTVPISCSPSPQPVGCASVLVDPDMRYLLTDSDGLKVYRDEPAGMQLPVDRIAALGSVDLADDDYGPLIPRIWSHSPMQLADGGRKLIITLGLGANGPRGAGPNTAIWSNPVCSCSVYESVSPAGEDRDF